MTFNIPCNPFTNVLLVVELKNFFHQALRPQASTDYYVVLSVSNSSICLYISLVMMLLVIETETTSVIRLRRKMYYDDRQK